MQQVRQMVDSTLTPAWDSQRGRLVINKRFPPEVRHITGMWFRDRFPKKITSAQAALRVAEQTIRYHELIEHAANALDSSEGRAEITRKLLDRRALIDAQTAEAIATRAALNDQLSDLEKLAQFGEIASRFGVRVELPRKPASVQPVTTDSVIEQWKAERASDGTPVKDKSERAYRRVAERMFAHLGIADDFRLLSKSNLASYSFDLISGAVAATAKSGKLPSPRGNLETIGALCAVAVRVALKQGVEMVNPSDGLRLPSKPKNRREIFTVEERAAVLVAARSAQPEVRWAHWLSAFCATIQSELRYLSPANVYAENGFTVLNIKAPDGLNLKTAWRPRALPLHSAILAEGFTDYVEQVRREHGDNAPLFPMTENVFQRETNRLITDTLGEDCGKTFYSHRHFVATELEGFHIVDEKGRKIDVSRVVCGHAALDVHEGNYIHRSLEQLLKAIETLPGA